MSLAARFVPFLRSTALEAKIHGSWSRLASNRRELSTMKQPIHLVLDWDGTMTVSDTTATIGARVLAKAHELALPGLPAYQRPEPMTYYSEFYMREYRQWRESFLPASGHDQPSTIADVVARLSESKDIEQRSFLRVRSAVLDTSGGISGLTEDERLRNAFMRESGQEAVSCGDVKIREPKVLKNLLVRANKSGSTWSIVSVSWSRQFLVGAMVEAGLVHPEEADTTAGRVKCNEILAPVSHHGSERPQIICTAQDKLNTFTEDVGTVSKSNDDDLVTIYVGDSTTDIGCLVGSGLGMYLSQDKTNDAVLEILNEFGIERLSIHELPISDVARKLRQMRDNFESQQKPRYTVCVIKSLSELEEWLSKLE